MIWQHFLVGSVAVLDGDPLMGLTLKYTGVKGLGVKGGGCEPGYEGLGLIPFSFWLNHHNSH